MKRFLCWSAALCVFLSIPYLGLWLYSRQWFEKEIERVYTEAPENGYQFLGPRPVLTGFPFVPEVYYGGGFRFGNVLVNFPEARLRGYPIPGLAFHLSVPRGISLGGAFDPDIWSLDTLEAAITMPSTFPIDIEEDALRAWQEDGGQFDVKSYDLTKGALQSEGKGKVSLDTELQPVIHVESRVKGYEEFITMLQQQGAIESLPAMAATAIMNSMAKPDPVTNENIVTMHISLENQSLRIGPLLAERLPKIDWPGTHNPPDQHQ